MAQDFKKLASSVVDAVGGVGNVTNLTHCMTRLRFILKDEAKASDETVKNIPGVMGLVKQGGQYQIIIGNNVAAAYKEILALGVDGGATVDASEQPKQKWTLKRVGMTILDAIIGTMTPLIPAIIGGSMVKLLAMLLLMTGVVGETNSTYVLLNTIGDAAFFFLPILVAVSASKKFGTNTYLAVAIAGLMVHPVFMDLMAKAAEGQAVTLAMLPITSVKYTYTIIPAIVMSWLLRYIEAGVDRITPLVTKNFLKPMLILLVGAVIAISIVGPAGVWLGNGISAVVYGIHGKLGWLAVAIVGAIWPLLVMTGMHRVFTPTIVTTIAETGSEAMVMPSEIGANMSLGGVSLAVAFKTKNRELRQTALAAASSALIAGITEPALYGVAIRLKRPMIASVITGFIAGAVAGLAGLASHSMAAPGLFTSVQFIDKDNPTSILWIAAVMAISVVVSFALTLILGFEDIPVEDDEADMVTPASVKLMAPMKGAVMGLHDVADEVFSKGLLGKGMAIEPVDGKVVSPIAGTVTTVFPTKHAIGLTDDHGMEVLIHVGLDTVSLNGEPFEALVAAGDRVEVGTELLQADLDAIKAAGLPTTTVVVITNTDEFKDVTPVEPGNVSFKDHVMEVFHHEKEDDAQTAVAADASLA
ncbi:PTS cellobiose/arbutin/salicin transporter subunit IIBC [Weissella confusa]|jgi:PTS system arbutin/cellobiose/salicin-specific IIC component|uniref:PTS system sucrose-specific EIIBCA component n=1 Tax=Weissella confusa TaxID=1583 RepID=A0AAJ2YXW2_WEICO|nr:PTS cellobiose/arbutin/salicin transporter subunit IIBC [Weissella confusa]MBJ7695345.1 PTS cellobiose/arbutin/salicin transporter subunit IIBC [Weissella confusa]NBA12109.1 PTS cellobiose/arbutin/salicin transporter subunit IIBC [Weissella confusa]QBZ05376.1 PTS cellobiose/arbutin/salicin transporter subunit IIBC [Weissella confusa]COJ23497.1 phosphotransferase system IIC component%2C glucose/maltose/N-acetylglucosamine-specific [Streptococcus pneumoniae]